MGGMRRSGKTKPLFLNGYGRLLTIRADIFGRSAIAGNICVGNRSHSAKGNGNGDADILRNREEAGTVFQSFADFATRCDNGIAAALGYGCACLCKGRNGDRHADRCGLIAYRGAGLRCFKQFSRVCHRTNVLLSFRTLLPYAGTTACVHKRCGVILKGTSKKMWGNAKNARCIPCIRTRRRGILRRAREFILKRSCRYVLLQL